MSLVDLLFPTSCLACGRPGRLVCPDCRRPLAARPRLAWPTPSPAGLPPPWTVASYAESTRSLVIAYKERDAIGLRTILATSLAATIGAAALGSRSIVVVPVPSSKQAIRIRGDDVMLVLARRAVQVLRREGRSARVVAALRHSRRVADSAGLDASARAANLSKAFVWDTRAGSLVGDAAVVIADDLITTGTTIAEAARALREGGVRVLGAATIAATVRRGVA